VVDKSKDVVIVDNSSADWKVADYLTQWSEFAARLDIATGYFEIGALLTMKDKWQQIDRIRILIGAKVSLRTKQAFDRGLAAIQGSLDSSIEHKKTKNDFLEGVPAIVEGIRSGRIQCRVYR
jgi:hypothetical protein